MTAGDQGIILHQYDISPYVRKVKIALAIKGLGWRGCTQPVIAPKPDLVALTGGYRRIPVLQIGADIYCDSDLIIRELDRRFPETPLGCDGPNAMLFALSPWFGALLTQTAVPIIFSDGRTVDPAFAKDREQVMGGPYVDITGWTAAAPHAAESFRAQLDWIDRTLAEGRPWLSGDAPGLLDIFAYPNLGFVREMRIDTAPIDRLDRVTAWEERIEALPEGRLADISTSEAVEVARAATPSTEGRVSADEPAELKAGDRVVVSAVDYGRDPVEGVLVSSSAQHVTIRRTDERAGEVNVHFPRFGFRVERRG
ncbi:MAG: hypothetical protein JWR77_2187 [Rhizorhabdus sp.]|nr:hypothetical protein [Rhizorhabdus sp.]